MTTGQIEKPYSPSTRNQILRWNLRVEKNLSEVSGNRKMATTPATTNDCFQEREMENVMKKRRHGGNIK